MVVSPDGPSAFRNKRTSDLAASNPNSYSDSHASVNPSKDPADASLCTRVPQSETEGGHEDRDRKVGDEGTFVGEPDFLFHLDRGG